MTCKRNGRRRLKPADYSIRAAVANALGNANRLMILDVLAVRQGRAAGAGGEMCVGEIVEMLGCDQSTASKHLSLLKNAGIVQDRRDGARVYYKLACPCITKFFDCIEEVISTRLTRQQKLLSGAKRSGA